MRPDHANIFFLCEGVGDRNRRNGKHPPGKICEGDGDMFVRGELVFFVEVKRRTPKDIDANQPGL